MRVSTSTITNMTTGSMSNAYETYMNVINKIAANKNFTSVSENVPDATKVLKLKDDLAQMGIYQSNIQAAMNEMNLAYQVYSNVATQLQLAKAKVQEAKPAFAVVEPATVPLQPSGTSRKMILIGIVFLAFAGTAAWILFGKDFWFKIKDEFIKDPSKTTEPLNE